MFLGGLAFFYERGTPVGYEAHHFTNFPPLDASHRQGALLKTRGNHTMNYDPFTERQLASRNSLSDHLWCKFGHVTPEFRGNETLKLHRMEWLFSKHAGT